MKVNENLTLAERMKAAAVTKIIRAGLVQEGDAGRIRLSDIPYFIDWATGFGGLWLVGETATGEEFFYTPDKWDALPDTQRESLLKQATGMLVRAKGHEFTLALQDCPDTYEWCQEDAFVDIANRSGLNSALTDFDGQKNTKALIAAGSPAAIAAENYKNTGIHNASAADWYLPAYGEEYLIFAYRNKINAALKTFFGTNNYLTQAVFWTSTPNTNAAAWILSNPSTSSYVSSGTYDSRSATNKVRACSQYKCTKRFMIYGKD